MRSIRPRADSAPDDFVQKLSSDTALEPSLASGCFGAGGIDLCVNNPPARIDFGGFAETHVVLANTLVEVFAVAGIPSPRLRYDNIDGEQNSLTPEACSDIWWRGQDLNLRSAAAEL